MVSVNEYYTQQGKHCVRVCTEKSQWISYQAQMICKAAPDWIAPCSNNKENNALTYDISSCVPLPAYREMQAEEIRQIRKELVRIQKETEAYLLDENSYCTEIKYIFWDPAAKKIRCLYIPAQADENESDWIQKITAQILGHAISEKWPETELLECYRMYLSARSEDGLQAPTDENEEDNGAEGERLAQQAAKTARLARYALWDSLEDEEEEESMKETVQKVKGKMRQIFSKKEK